MVGCSNAAKIDDTFVTCQVDIYIKTCKLEYTLISESFSSKKYNFHEITKDSILINHCTFIFQTQLHIKHVESRKRRLLGPQKISKKADCARRTFVKTELTIRSSSPSPKLFRLHKFTEP